MGFCGHKLALTMKVDKTLSQLFAEKMNISSYVVQSGFCGLCPLRRMNLETRYSDFRFLRVCPTGMVAFVNSIKCLLRTMYRH